MATFEWIVALLLGTPYPTLLAIGGVLLAFISGSPNWTLDPQMALGSWAELKARRRLTPRLHKEQRVSPL